MLWLFGFMTRKPVLCSANHTCMMAAWHKKWHSRLSAFSRDQYHSVQYERLWLPTLARGIAGRTKTTAATCSSGTGVYETGNPEPCLGGGSTRHQAPSECISRQIPPPHKTSRKNGLRISGPPRLRAATVHILAGRRFRIFAMNAGSC
jgi:hypothetical protein